MHSKFIDVTPELAREWLARNTMNRPLNVIRARRFAEDMRTGRWKPNGQTIIFAEEGELLDGQHRLEAIVQSGLSFPFLIVENVSRDAFHTIDTGSGRSFADLLGIQGHKNAHTLAGCIRIAYVYIAGYNYNHMPSRQAMNDFAVRYPHIILCNNAAQEGKKRTLLPRSPLGAAMFLATAATPHYFPLFQAFVHELATGELLKRGDPALTLRDWSTYQRARGKGTIHGYLSFAAIIRAWNAYAHRKQITNLRPPAAVSRETVPIDGYRHSFFRDFDKPLTQDEAAAHV